MGTFLKVLGVLVLGTLLGLAATWATVIRGGWGGAVSDGPWKTSLTTGSSEGGIYQRASVAVHGLLALNRSETIYYTANTDSFGNPLVGSCFYSIKGHDLPARWWSITIYGADDYLIPNPWNRYSISKNSVIHEPDGTFLLFVAKGHGHDGTNWIPVSDGRFSLSLRLYNPSREVAADPAHVALPVIETISKVRCP